MYLGKKKQKTKKDTFNLENRGSISYKWIQIKCFDLFPPLMSENEKWNVKNFIILNQTCDNLLLFL